jgi:hypothetical protein
LPKDILILCETPKKLIEFVGTTPFMIKLPQNDRNETIRITNPRIRKRGIPMHYHLHNFLMWRIPSDFYKLKTPSLELIGHHVKQKKSRRQNIKAEGNSFRFITDRILPEPA